MKLLTTFGAAAMFSLPAGAQELRSCDTFEANARNTYPPYEETIRSYANGDIRVIALDVGEPAAASYHLMVIHPFPDEPFPACSLVSYSGNSGFGWLDMGAISATYDPSQGLSIHIPTTSYDPVSTGQMPGGLTVIVNQATGMVTAYGQSAEVTEPSAPEQAK